MGTFIAGGGTYSAVADFVFSPWETFARSPSVSRILAVCVLLWIERSVVFCPVGRIVLLL